MVNNLFDRLKAGETVNVRVPDSGLLFSIEPARSHGLILGYSIVLDGAIVPGHKGTLMDRATITDWANDLDEQ